MKIITEYLSESLNSTPKNFKQFGKAFFDAVNDSSEYGWWFSDASSREQKEAKSDISEILNKYITNGVLTLTDKDIKAIANKLKFSEWDYNGSNDDDQMIDLVKFAIQSIENKYNLKILK